MLAVPDPHELILVLACLLNDLVALFLRGLVECSLDDLIPKHVFHEVDDHAVVLALDDGLDQHRLVRGRTLLETHLHHVGRELLVAQRQQVLTHDAHHLVAPDGVPLLDDVLDDLVALLVFGQDHNLVHDFVLEHFVQEC